jgi:hypothetical protein
MIPWFYRMMTIINIFAEDPISTTMMKLFFGVFAALMLAPVSGKGAVSLTLESFDEVRGSRNAFVKFQAPW